MARMAMVIDLRLCIGCDACNISCKQENNVQQGFFWAHHIQRHEGTFPNITYTYMPTLCNHCSNPPCVEACPVEPDKAMFKQADGTVMTSEERCIGCQACKFACPYGVISFNEWGQETHPEWRTPEAAALAQKVGGEVVAYSNPDRGTTFSVIRKEGKVEKCTFCDHRYQVGHDPRCVEVCPPHARIFGDLDDPNSEVSRLLRENEYSVLQPEAGTEPNVYYINKFDQKS